MCAGMSSPDVNAIGGGPETGATNAKRRIIAQVAARRMTAVAHFRRATGTTPNTGMPRLSPFETYAYDAARASDAANANAAAATARHALFMSM
ncbi:hypothetical protein WS87_30960 [Burkholderia sp. MSMB0856]|nr:hypothetical protein WS87_30960 [Burkholderia sp. MSMB0856]KVH27916.1 hypothetical protein WS87_29600 [Burkholderia sp. MSMB0856]